MLRWNNDLSAILDELEGDTEVVFDWEDDLPVDWESLPPDWAALEIMLGLYGEA